MYSSNIISVSEQNRMRWAGHVWGKNKCSQVFVWKLKKKDQLEHLGNDGTLDKHGCEDAKWFGLLNNVSYGTLCEHSYKYSNFVKGNFLISP
jgi:hypothetical protein